MLEDSNTLVSCHDSMEYTPEHISGIVDYTRVRLRHYVQVNSSDCDLFGRQQSCFVIECAFVIQ